jgi:hypothetical protein
MSFKPCTEKLAALVITSQRKMERVKGIEPSYEAWEASVLPLNYTRSVLGFYVSYANLSKLVISSIEVEHVTDICDPPGNTQKIPTNYATSAAFLTLH